MAAFKKRVVFLFQQKVFTFRVVRRHQEVRGDEKRAADLVPVGSEGHPVRGPEALRYPAPPKAPSEQARPHPSDQRGQ